jgi:hypothetical protein
MYLRKTEHETKRTMSKIMMTRKGSKRCYKERTREETEERKAYGRLRGSTARSDKEKMYLDCVASFLQFS